MVGCACLLPFCDPNLDALASSTTARRKADRVVSDDEDPKSFGESEQHSELGQMMIEMLPEDLAFTVFVPSGRAFERDLGLRANETLMVEKEKEKMNDDSYAIVSRVLGFSAVPRTLVSDDVPFGKQVLYDSISGFVLYISKDVDGMLVVNRVRSQRVDVKRKEIVVHVMDRVTMDDEFEESVRPTKMNMTSET